MSFVKKTYLVIVEKEAEEEGEPQHGHSVHAIVQVILQELLPRDYMVPNYVFPLCHTYKEKSARDLLSWPHSALLSQNHGAEKRSSGLSVCKAHRTQKDCIVIWALISPVGCSRTSR